MPFSSSVGLIDCLNVHHMLESETEEDAQKVVVREMDVGHRTVVHMRVVL